MYIVKSIFYITAILINVLFSCYSYCCYYLLVGNKNDNPEKKVVDLAEAQKYADQVGIDLFETSAKDNINVEDVRTKCYYYKVLSIWYC